EWDPFTSAVLTEVGGKVNFKEIIEGENVREETDKVTGLTQMVIVESAVAEKRTPTLIIKAGKSEEKKYLLPTGAHVMVHNGQEGERVRAGDPLIDGPIDPHDVLSVLGIKELQKYLVAKIQEVYRSQSVQINDKHIETICRQMLRSVRITRVGDTDFLVDEQVDRFRFMEENEKVMNRGGEPADGVPLLLGITKASLSTDSFISAAS